MKTKVSYPKVLEVEPLENYELRLVFEDGKTGIFDMKPHLNKGVFRQLKNAKMFNIVRTAWGSIAWQNDIDIAVECLYDNSVDADF